MAGVRGRRVSRAVVMSCMLHLLRNFRLRLDGHIQPPTDVAIRREHAQKFLATRLPHRGMDVSAEHKLLEPGIDRVFLVTQ